MATHAVAPDWAPIDRLLDLALAEDVGAGDVTTEALVPEDAVATGAFVAREAGVLAGLEVVERLYGKLDPAVAVTRHLGEGEHFSAGRVLAGIAGPARAILTGERLALNLLQRMSGVATVSDTYARAVEGTKAKIYDTRKTMPGMRALDKLAVCCGGANNHRAGLHDMVLIKDNHLALMGPSCPEGSTACAVAKARQHTDLPVMVEVESLDQLREVLEVEPDMILLDNMDLDMLRESVRVTFGFARDRGLRRPLLEASGGVTLAAVRDIAETGVDRISVGALTHSARSLDIALDFPVETP